MTIIICIDDNGGMTFNNRRQSRDKALLADIAKDVELSGRSLVATPFSQKLLAEADIPCDISDTPFECAGQGQLCFIENLPLSAHLDSIGAVTVYRWNRKYPHDTVLDIDVAANFRHVKTEEFAGNAHEKITKDVYVR